MSSAGSSRVITRMPTCSRFLTRVAHIVATLFCLTGLTACMGPAKPVPPTQSHAEQAPPATETVEGPKTLDPAPAPVPEPRIPLLPFPPIGSGQSIEEQDKVEVPVVEAKPVHVTAQRESYNVERATSATKTDTPIMETPISIQVIPQAVLQDQQAIQIEDAVKNVSGVFPGFTFGGFGEEFIIRGFNTNFNNYRDGFRLSADRLPLANIERIEVVKGAAANLYGRIEPGGMINLVTKRPQAESMYSLNQQFGSYNEYRTTADATGRLTTDGTLLYRFNLEYLNKDSFRDYGFTKRIFVAPSLTWKMTPRTQLDLDFNYLNQDTREDYGIVAVGNRPASIPRSRYLGEPTTDKSNTGFYNSTATLTHAIHENWKVRARFNYARRDVVDPQTSGASLDEQTGELQRFFYKGNATGNTYMGTVDLTGRFDTAGIEHDVLVGWDYYGGFTDVKSTSLAANPINIYNPQYDPTNLAGVKNNFFIDQRTQWNGLYFQDQITLFDKLHILGGGRYDWATQELGLAFGADQSVADATNNINKAKNNRFNPRAGIVYQPWQWLSLYGNYVQSLGSANLAFDASGNILDPQYAEQYEAGFKTAFFNDRLTSTVAFYHLTKENLPVQVPGQPFSEAVGEARSQGVEVDIAGRITEGLSIITTYAYTDAEIMKGDNKGNRLWNVPKHAGSVWLKYDMQQEPLRGLTVGGGVFAQGKRQGDNQNSYQLPSYARVDALMKYQIPITMARMTLQLNVNNLLDQKYYGGTLGDRFSINVGAPRTFIGSIRIAY
ncbi:MAG TPA: TonB-dependent siderophore receptor [Nitrospirales bacterium]|nr:TonB-dependent siderophore receptor [Nitrospirales bacterium]